MTKRINQRRPGAQPGNHNAKRHGFYAAPRPEPETSDPTIRKMQKVGRAMDETREKIIAAINKDPETASELSDALVSLARLNQEELDCYNELRRQALRSRMRQRLGNPRLSIRRH